MRHEYTAKEIQAVITRLNVRLRVVPPEVGFYRNWTVVLSGPAGTTAAQGEDVDEAFARAVERLEQERAHARA